MLEAVATCLDTLEGLSRYPAPLSPASILQQIRNYNVDAVDLVDILPPQRLNSCMQCLKHSPKVMCKKTLRSVNCKRCSLAGYKESCVEVCSLVFVLSVFLM